jgi:hypothetical protein
VPVAVPILAGATVRVASDCEGPQQLGSAPPCPLVLLSGSMERHTCYTRAGMECP